MKESKASSVSVRPLWEMTPDAQDHRAGHLGAMSSRRAPLPAAYIHPCAPARARSQQRNVRRRRFTREVGISLPLDKYDGLGRPRSALHLDPAPLVTWRPACGPTGEFFCPQAALGTSITMLHTFLSAKKSSPVNWRLFFAPATSQKKGSLRQPAKKRYRRPRDSCAWPSRNRRPFNDNQPAIAVRRGLRAIDAA